MASNSFGEIIRLTTFGESHGEAIGGVLDGFPAGVQIKFDFIADELNRRKPGQSALTTQRKEQDSVAFLSGFKKNITTGTPIAWQIANTDAKNKDYKHLENTYRPSHADFTYEQKFGLRTVEGGGRSSARETANWVVAGALCKQLLALQKINCYAYVSQIGAIELAEDPENLPLYKTDLSEVRCPNSKVSDQMIRYLKEIKKEGDSVGGVITGYVTGVPAGLGDPVFRKLHAILGQALFSINAVKGVEFGSGFRGSRYKGSSQNDIFEEKNGKIVTKTNNSGGIQGGISNGMPIIFRVAFKPVATVMKNQETVDKNGKKIVLKGKGRHDPCVVPRAVPIVEALTALVLADFLMLNRTNKV